MKLSGLLSGVLLGVILSTSSYAGPWLACGDLTAHMVPAIGPRALTVRDVLPPSVLRDRAMMGIYDRSTLITSSMPTPNRSIARSSADADLHDSGSPSFQRNHVPPAHVPPAFPTAAFPTAALSNSLSYGSIHDSSSPWYQRNHVPPAHVPPAAAFSIETVLAKVATPTQSAVEPATPIMSSTFLNLTDPMAPGFAQNKNVRGAPEAAAEVPHTAQTDSGIAHDSARPGYYDEHQKGRDRAAPHQLSGDNGLPERAVSLSLTGLVPYQGRTEEPAVPSEHP